MKKLMILCMIAAAPMSAKYHKVASLSEFERLVDGYQYSVACFASASKQKGEDIASDELKGRQKEFRNLQEILKSAASKYDFKKFLSKDIGFIAVDVASKHGQDLVNNLKIDATTPVCYAFDQGAQDKDSKLINPDSTKDVVDLLEDTAGSELDYLLADRKEEYSQDRQERVAAYYAYGGFYPYGWGYGWGGSSYWHRPYWGWGYLW